MLGGLAEIEVIAVIEGPREVHGKYETTERCWIDGVEQNPKIKTRESRWWQVIVTVSIDSGDGERRVISYQTEEHVRKIVPGYKYYDHPYDE